MLSGREIICMDIYIYKTFLFRICYLPALQPSRDRGDTITSPSLSSGLNRHTSRAKRLPIAKRTAPETARAMEGVALGQKQQFLLRVGDYL